MQDPTLHLDLPERVRWYVRIRWFYLLFLASAGIVPLLVTTGLSEDLRRQSVIALIGITLNGLFFVTARYKKGSKNYYLFLAAAQVSFDLLLATLVIFANGGIESRSVILYVIPIIMTGALLGQRSIYFAAGASIFLYGLITSLDHFKFVTPPNIVIPSVHTDTSYYLRSIFFYSAVLLAIALITNYVGRLVRQRERLEKEIKTINTEKAEIEAIIKTMGSALVATDIEGRITLVNTAFERLTGWRRLEVLGRPLYEVLVMLDEWGHVVPPAERPLFKILRQTSLDTSQPQIINDFYYRRKDGSSFPFVAHVAPITLSKQMIGPIGATTVFDDATTSKEMEKLKSNFVALVSHQLKTPIGEIKGYIENMLYGLAGKVTTKQAEYLQHMYDVANRSNQLISNLLDMAILQREAFKVHLRPVKLNTVIEEVADIYQERVKQKKLSLEIKEANKELVVIADKSELIEVLGNLLNNSISYSQRGVIRIETKEDSDHGIIEVSDQGRGIDPEALQTIFHKEQVLAQAPAAESGTGLGLYLARQLVLLQKGDIQVNSTVGKGTTFSIKLPKKGKKVTPVADTDNPLLNKNAKTILIVEDELPFRQIYRDILRLDGFNVIEAEDGEEGLKLVKNHKPDLVLLDIILPKLSGFDVLTHIKKTPELQHIPVIVYSIINNKAEIDRAIKLGANDFTVKGQTPAFEVLNKVRKLLA